MQKPRPTIPEIKKETGETFTISQIQSFGITKYRLYRLRDQGFILSLGGGVYRWSDAEPLDFNLIEIAQRCPQATLCLDTALARHGLIDHIPSTIDIAVPRGSSRIRFQSPVQLHYFNGKTFELGRALFSIGEGRFIGLYSPERSIVDAIRLRHNQGNEQAWEALRKWLAKGGAHTSTLMQVAKKIRGAEKPLRSALELLL